MNIFVLDQHPRIAAEMHCDKHVVKMILEYAQLLSAAHRLIDGKSTVFSYADGAKVKTKRFWLLGDERVGVVQTPGGPRAQVLNPICYAATHVNHPCAIWARANDENYRWLQQLLSHLMDEYTLRYNRAHATQKHAAFLMNTPVRIKPGELSQFPQAMPVEYQVPNDAIAAYQAFYVGSKSRFAKWTKRPAPDWFISAMATKGFHASNFSRTRRVHSSASQGSRLIDQGAVAT